ncbi:MAG: hypothetical protein SCARUB_03980 [Candidatus Scalindua rubra]|uniref:Transposase n=1 Tax=Candidatus Scalindua rubra TaxID=1872076 RepID=A0A1E3X5R9_9BACT|nr:MAG: hypothetical protein SCARUB_03980 [Candidatus Scalindua rubra]
MGMGCTRVVERVMASIGKLSEAPSRFKASLDVSNAGALWALPALLSNGLLRHTKEYFNLPKGFYSLVHVFLLLGYMSLSRIKTNERLRYSSAGEWGLLLGLDRIPEVRTLRDKIKHLSEAGQVAQWSAIVSKGLDGGATRSGGNLICRRSCSCLSWITGKTAPSLCVEREVMLAWDVRLLGKRSTRTAIFCH